MKTKKFEKLMEERETYPVLSIGFIMMSEENKDDLAVFLVDGEFEDKTIHNMNPPLSDEDISEGLIMVGVEEDLIDFSSEAFFKKRVSPGCFIYSSSAGRHEIRSVNHFNESKNSSADLYLIGVSSSNTLFNSLICAPFIGNSSTGCQSIDSQNRQSSSVTLFVLRYLSNISFFKISSLPTSDQLTHKNIESFSFSLGSNGTVRLTIYNSPFPLNFSNSSTLFFNPCLNTSGQFIPGCLSILSLSSLGMEKVILISFVILNFSGCVDTRKCVDVFKSFSSEPIKNFGENFGETREKIVGLIRKNPEITQEELSAETGLTIKGIEWNLAKLKEKGLLKRVGPDKGGHWEVIEK